MRGGVVNKSRLSVCVVQLHHRRGGARRPVEGVVYRCWWNRHERRAPGWLRRASPQRHRAVRCVKTDKRKDVELNSGDKLSIDTLLMASHFETSGRGAVRESASMVWPRASTKGERTDVKGPGDRECSAGTGPLCASPRRAEGGRVERSEQCAWRGVAAMTHSHLHSHSHPREERHCRKGRGGEREKRRRGVTRG